jgi:hypothetical protein
MKTNSWIYLTAILVSGFGAVDTALAQRAERALALSEASQTIQRFFTCIAEGANSNGNATRDARAAACLRDELHPDAVVVFNGNTIPGADAIVATFTGPGQNAASQFSNTVLDVHTIVDKGFQPRNGFIDAKIRLRLTVVTSLTNAGPSPVFPLPAGNFTFTASEDFELEEEQPGRWVINRSDVVLLTTIPLPANAFVTPFPVLPSVRRNP